jgi:energy-coupling factor transport system permease protein
VKPLPVTVTVCAVLVISIAAQNPVCLAGSVVAASALLWSATPPRRPYVIFALISGATVFILNPFVGVQGLTVLWQGPQIPILDTQITLEEVVFGAGAAARLVASALAAAAFVRLADPDLLLTAVSRVAPRSGMIVSLATRMLPVLERDAAGLVLAARTRAGRLGTPRGAGGLLAPLVGMSLERSLEMAEAMEARGYGGPGRTRAPERPPGRRDRALVAVGAAATGLVTYALIGGATAYRYYDTLADPLQPGPVAGAVALAALMAASAGMVRWLR